VRQFHFGGYRTTRPDIADWIGKEAAMTQHSDVGVGIPRRDTGRDPPLQSGESGGERPAGAFACTEGEDGAGAGDGPAHARTLEADLDDMGGGRLDSAGANRQAIEAEDVVGHPLGMLAKVATLPSEGLTGRRRGGRDRRERGEDRVGAGGEQGMGRPRARR
jgi:hypothetical protein